MDEVLKNISDFSASLDMLEASSPTVQGTSSPARSHGGGIPTTSDPSPYQKTRKGGNIQQAEDSADSRIQRTGKQRDSSGTIRTLVRGMSFISRAIGGVFTASDKEDMRAKATVTLDDPNATQITFDPNRIMAQGGYCDVFMGANPTGRRIALKRYRITVHGYGKEDLQVIENEAKVWRGLEHEFILPFLGIGQDPTDFWYLASPWMDNGTLPTFLRENSETADRPRFILEVAEALAYLESKRVIHGDIRGSNVLVSPDHHALLYDFGLSKIAGVATLKPLRGAGSTLWQSPELLKNEPKSYASDIYAFGITIYEVLTDNLPSHYHQPPGSVFLVVYENKPPMRPEACGSHGYLWDIAEQCWKKNPDDRPSIQIVLRWLQQRKCDFLEDVCGLVGPSSDSQGSPGASTGRQTRFDSHRVRSRDTAANISEDTIPPLLLLQHQGPTSTPAHLVNIAADPDAGC
ncbi:hypothetical protein FRB99_008617 [Tulasnella sp. 403]|nr:hypothetical protein FRB99_008617 [Tulasnella sp. 403]